MSSPPERIDPEVESPGIVAHHMAKYTFANERVGSGNVLDVGCGVGYGTAALVRASRFVVGIDIADEALDVAQTRYVRPRLVFLRGDGENLPFRDNRFNGVVCFEAIEHFANPPRHVSEVARVLRPDGVYILSTPRPGTGGSPAENPYHWHEFSRVEFEGLLQDFFGKVKILGQRRKRDSVREVARQLDVLDIRKFRGLRPVARVAACILGTTATEDARLEDFVIDLAGAVAGTEFVAVCREPRSGRSLPYQ